MVTFLPSFSLAEELFVPELELEPPDPDPQAVSETDSKLANTKAVTFFILVLFKAYPPI
ncbi:hypothetical protein D3C76_1533960 [compost metagenome]